MRFEIQKHTKRGIDCLERVGKLCSENDACKTAKTPTCTLFMSSGAIPFVTNDLLKYINFIPKIAEIPFSTLIQSKDNLIKMGKPFGNFIAMKDYITYLSIHDNSKIYQTGYNEGKKIAIWSKRGKNLITSEVFEEFIKSVHFDVVECPYDDFNEVVESKKQIKKAIERTKNFVDWFFGEKTEKPQNTEIIMPIVGNNDIENRKLFIEHLKISNYKFNGSIYHGFERDKTSLTITDVQKYKKIIQITNKELLSDEENHFKFFSLPTRPDQVVEAVELGFDIFTGTYPYIITQKGYATIFETKNELIKDPNYEFDEDEGSKKKIKLDSLESEKLNQEDLVIDLNDKKFAEDFNPLKKDCPCYSCNNFTRAYINHLLNTKEISAQTILMIHNISNYFDFFEELRNSIENDYFENFKKFVSNQFKNTTRLKL